MISCIILFYFVSCLIKMSAKTIFMLCN